MRTWILRRGFCLCVPLLALASSLAAQAMAPPPYLQIFQEQVKVGRAGAHPAIESGWPRAFAKAKTPNYYIGMTTVYGPPEAWFSGGARSIAELEEQNQAVEKTPGLTRELDRLSQAEIWEVLIFNVRPGHEGNFAEGAKLYRTMVEGAKVAAPWGDV